MTHVGPRRIGIWLVALIAGASVSRAQPAELIDRVLAVAAGDIIMLSDVRAALDFALVETAPAPDPVRSVLSRMIDRALILDEVDRYAPPEPSPDAIERALAAVRARFPLPDAFAVALARSGLDEQRLRASLRQNLRLQAYLGQRFAADSPERRQSMIDDWVSSLRRRADIVDLYSARPR